jgi:hypothetical protein
VDHAYARALEDFANGDKDPPQDSIDKQALIAIQVKSTANTKATTPLLFSYLFSAIFSLLFLIRTLLKRNF